MRAITNLLAKHPALNELQTNIGPFKQQMVSGAGSEHQALVVSYLGNKGHPLLVIVPGEREAVVMQENLTTLLPHKNIFLFPSINIIPGQVWASSSHLAVRRLQTIWALLTEDEPLVVAPAEALARTLTPLGVMKASILKLTVGSIWELQSLRHKLITLGYKAVTRVEAPGQFALRGGILDLFAFTEVLPVRIEFFGDEVSGMRWFSPQTQLSQAEAAQVVVVPANELVISAELWTKAQKKVDSAYQLQAKLFPKGDKAWHRLHDRWAYVNEHFQAHDYFPGIEDYLPYFYSQPARFSDYLPERALLIWSEPERVAESLAALAKQRVEQHVTLLTEGRAVPGQLKGHLSPEDIIQSADNHPSIYLSLFGRARGFPAFKKSINFPVSEPPVLSGEMEAFIQSIRQRQKAGQRVLVLLSAKDRVQKTIRLFRQEGVTAFEVTGEEGLKSGEVGVALGQLHTGLELPDLLVVFTEKELYGKKFSVPLPTAEVKEKSLDDLDLKPGDYVVHINHGIGRYQGVVLLSIGNVKREYALVGYAGEDKLYVPADQLGLIQKYVGAEGQAPKLSRLGSSEWKQTKKRVRQAVQEMAEELIDLYATRENKEGYSFGPDTPWQREFEEAFPYEETADQLQSIAEIKADMQKPRPMDRLLCGDVGYGKTEVAMRAAFKSVTENKQVAVLVPTTVLAQQHWQTFAERFAGYPIEVEMVSRFRSEQEIRKVLRRVKHGKTDILIGTHRLVQEDVQFKDLGLIVIDEEQRFGVLHKERLKIKYPHVDVLTLTATPIPRTLYMSMVGVRDASLIRTPPQERQPVQTFVVEEDMVLIKEAVNRELARGGQVFFVHNRIQDLEHVTAWLSKLVPEARITMAHGQMPEDQLEKKMMDFVAARYDVLVCTTIIETGLDIPNVNTLIVKDSEQLGLAQLYQLRGRVGRSSRLAYAYFTFSRDRLVGETAEKRLQAIRDFTDFGSGFRLAKRDLEIRGAGNLLGTSQHGNIAHVGFDLYTSLLEESVRELKGEKLSEEHETLIELPVSAYLSEDYMPDSEERVRVYHQLARSGDEQEIQALKKELEDRFGTCPQAVANLFDVALLRLKARPLGVKSIFMQNNRARFVLGESHSLKGEALTALAGVYPEKLRFKEAEDGFEIWLHLEKYTDDVAMLSELHSFIDHVEHYLEEPVLNKQIGAK